MKKNEDKRSKFSSYADQLKDIKGVTAKLTKSKEKESWAFTPSNPNALKVVLEYHLQDMISGEISLDITGTDSGFWHTEEVDLDFHIKLAVAALKGDVAHNFSRVFKFEEICFKVDGVWQCTRMGNPRFGYIKKRRKLNSDKS